MSDLIHHPTIAELVGAVPAEDQEPWIPSVDVEDESLKAFYEDLFGGPEFLAEYERILVEKWHALMITGELA